MEFYFVATSDKNKTEIPVIKELKPNNLMLSYHYFKNIKLSEFIKVIGYKPRIILDSGAYSAWSQGKEINLEKYTQYIEDNKEYIYRYMTLDKLGDTEKSFEVYEEMKNRGLNPIPVFHYLGDEKVLEKYINNGETFIALGGTVPIKSKGKVAEWVRMVSWLYPEVDYHLLGSASRKILDHCDISSADAATWIIGALNGLPKTIKGNCETSRILRAAENMKKYISLFDKPTENLHHDNKTIRGKHGDYEGGSKGNFKN